MASLGHSRPTPPLVHPTESSYCCPCSERVNHGQSRELAGERGLCLPCRGPGMAACCCEQSALDMRLREQDLYVVVCQLARSFYLWRLFNPEPMYVGCVYAHLRVHDFQWAETRVCPCAHTDRGIHVCPWTWCTRPRNRAAAAPAPPTFSSGCDWETQAASVYLPCGFFCPTRLWNRRKTCGAGLRKHPRVYVHSQEPRPRTARGFQKGSFYSYPSIRPGVQCVPFELFQ